MEDIIIFMIPIVGVLTTGAVIMAFSPLGRGIAERLKGSGGAGDEELRMVMQEQSARLAAAEDQIHSLQERIDFTEQLLQARPTETGRLSSGEGGETSQG